MSGKPTDALIETLRHAAGRGELHDFAPGLADMDLDPAKGARWPPEREVAAELLRSILLDPDLRPDPRGLRLRGALVTGILDLDHVALPCPLVLIRSHFRRPPTFEYATLPHLALATCHLPGLSLDGARVDGDAFLGGLTATGEVRALGAQITGQLDLQVLVAQAFADRREADAVVDELGRVRVAQLVQRRGDARGRAVGRPAPLGGLVRQRTAAPVLLRAKQRAMAVTGVLQKAAQGCDELRVVEQHGASALAFAEHGEVLVVGCEVEVLDVARERFAGAQAGRGDQPEQQPVAL